MSKADAAIGPRRRARELALQALYQMQIAGHGRRELMAQFRERPDYERVDREYFDELLPAVCDDFAGLSERIGGFADRPVVQLDPVELAVLAIGIYELESRPDVPFRAIIDEGVNLARRFGAEDGHKYVNAVLDRAARETRPAET